MFNIRRRPSGRPNDALRQGTATVELAVCLPMLVVLVFGSIQACDLIFLKHTVTAAAYEGSLELVRPDSTIEKVRTRVDQVLGLSGVTNYSVSIRPDGVNLAETTAGTPITVVVSANVKSNLMLSGFFATSPSVSTELVCPR